VKPHAEFQFYRIQHFQFFIYLFNLFNLFNLFSFDQDFNLFTSDDQDYLFHLVTAGLSIFLCPYRRAKEKNILPALKKQNHYLVSDLQETCIDR